MRDELTPAVVGSLLMLLNDLVTCAWDLCDSCHAYQTGQCDALGPYTCLNQLLGECHRLCVNVGENATHAGCPSGSDDGELVLLGPSERFVTTREFGPLTFFSGLVPALNSCTSVGVVGLVEGDTCLIGCNDTGSDGNGRDEEELDGRSEAAECRPGSVEKESGGCGEGETLTETDCGSRDGSVVLTAEGKREGRSYQL